MLKYVELIFHIKTEVSLGDTGGKNNLVWREFISRRNKLGDFINKWDSNNKILQKVKKNTRN
jgi:hypothetical protein